jgi:hypothetical protein
MHSYVYTFTYICNYRCVYIRAYHEHINIYIVCVCVLRLHYYLALVSRHARLEACVLALAQCLICMKTYAHVCSRMRACISSVPDMPDLDALRA